MNMKIKGFFIAVVLLFTIIVPTYSRAEGVLTEWIRSYGEYEKNYGTSIAVGSTGNVYVTGFQYGPVYYPAGDYRDNAYTTVKYGTNGNLLWVKKYPTRATYDYINIKVDSLDNVYVFGPVATIKYDTDGNELWVRPGSTSLAVDSSGNVYASGGNGTIKYDANGSELWTRAEGGLLAVDSTGNVYVSGGNGIIVKFDANGNELWSTPGGGYIAVDSVGCVYTAGTENEDYVTTKYDPNGNTVWSKRFDSGQADIVSAFAVDALGNVIVTGGGYYGSSSSDYVTVKYDANGNEMWVKRYDGGVGYDGPWALVIDPIGNIYITGQSAKVVYNRTQLQSVTIKYDAAGNELWNKAYHYYWEGNTRTTSIALDAANNVYVGGYVNDGWGYYGYLAIKYSQDSQGPTITINEPQNIWPPNGKLANIAVTGTIVDSGSGVASASYVIADEYNEISYTGAISLSAEGNFYLSLPLDAYRKGSDTDGRAYYLRVTAIDKVGNASSASKEIKVLHDQGVK